MIRRIIRKVFVRKNALPVLNPKRICVFKIGAMGDVLMSTPMLHALRQRFPNALIHYWTGQWSAAVLKGNEDIDHLFVFDDRVFYQKRPDLALRLAAQVRAQKYDVMIVLDKHWSLGVFARLTGIPVRVGFDREGEGFAHTIAVPYDRVRHEVDYYLDLARAVGAELPKKPRLEFVLGAKDRGFARFFFAKHKLVPSRTIGIIPGGAKNPGQLMAIRRWPVERFGIVAKALSREGWQILLLGKSPGDDDVLSAMKTAVPEAVNAIGNFTLQRSAALVQQCRLVVCNDSGPMHVAAAVGTPTVSIFGATDPHRKAPRGQGHRWVWNPVNCVRAEMYGRYDEPRLIRNILNVEPKHVLKAVHELVKK